MPNVESMILGDLDTNCYLVWGQNSESCVIIDPAASPERILNRAAQLGKTVQAILLTHGHFDHVGGVKAVAEKTGCAVYLCTQDLTLPPRLTDGPLYYTQPYGEGDIVQAANLTFQVLHTPGHTAGSVCLITEDALFSGDTLFAGTCGRTDIPGSSPVAMARSLARLGALPGDYTVYPGHGRSSTLSYERQTNPYLRGFL